MFNAFYVILSSFSFMFCNNNILRQSIFNLATVFSTRRPDRCAGQSIEISPFTTDTLEIVR